MTGIKGINIGKTNGMWKEDVSYQGLHQWVRRSLRQPVHCQSCFLNKPLEVANISQEYKRDLTDWEWICRSCHMKKDGRINQIGMKKGFKPNKKQLEALRIGRLRRWEKGLIKPCNST